jgi:hypothetical protein
LGRPSNFLNEDVSISIAARAPRYEPPIPITTNTSEFTLIRVKTLHKTIHEGTGAGNNFLGWVDLPIDYDKEEFMITYKNNFRIVIICSK